MSDIFDTLDAPETTQQRDIFDDLEVKSEPTQEQLSNLSASLARQDELREPSITSTTVGGGRVPLATFGETIAEPAEEFTKPALRFSEIIPPVKPEESVVSAGAKTLGRVALGIPEFFTSKAGLATLAAGPAAPKFTAGLFAADMLRGVPKEATAIGEQWDRMTPAQQTEAIVALSANTFLGAGLGAKALSKFTPKPTVKPTPKVEPPAVQEAVDAAREDLKVSVAELEKESVKPSDIATIEPAIIGEVGKPAIEPTTPVAQPEIVGEAKPPTAPEVAPKPIVETPQPSIEKSSVVEEVKPSIITEGDTIRWEPNEKERRYQSPVQGIVQDVIQNSDGDIGFHIFSPTEGDPYNVVRVWSNRGKIVSRTPKSVEKQGSPSVLGVGEATSGGNVSPETGAGRTQNRPKTIVEIADEIAAKGIDPQDSYGLFVKARDLKPEIDAKEWLKIYRQSLELANLDKQIKTGKQPIVESAKTTGETSVKQPWEMTQEQIAESSGAFSPGVVGNFFKYLKSFDTSPAASQKTMSKYPDYDYAARMSGVTADGVSRLIAQRQGHHEAVAKALREGKPVPQEVLAEYPDLQAKQPTPNEIQVTQTGGSIVEQKQPVVQETAVEAQAGTTQRQGAGETRPAQGEVLLEPNVTSGPVSFTDKSVRDHSQQAVIKVDTITVNAKVGGKKTASYTIPLSEWIAAEKGPSANPNWNRAKLVEKYSEKLGLDEQSGGPEQAQRIRDSQVRAIQGALSKQPTKPNTGPGAANVGQGAIGVTPLTTLPVSTTPSLTVKGQRQIIADIAKGLSIPIRFGNMTSRKYAGVFESVANLIRTKKANQVVTVGHEAGHKIDSTFRLSSDPTISSELNALGDPALLGKMSSWTPSKTHAYKMGEGVGEFVRMWLTEPENVPSAAPNTLRLWESILNANKDLGDTMRQAQHDVKLWRTAEPTARMMSNVSVGENPNKTPYSISQLTRDLVDDLHFARLAMDDAKKSSRTSIPPSKDIYLLARNLRGSYGMADTFIRHGVVDFNTKRVTPGTSLLDVLKPVSGRMSDFREYMIARRASELHRRGLETGLLDADVTATLNKYAGDPVLPATFDALKQWNDSLLKYAVDAGLIDRGVPATATTPATGAEAMRALNQDYVPFHRVFEVGANEKPSAESVGTGRGLNLGKPGSLRKIKGSDRPIVDPLETIIKNAYVIVTASEKSAIHSALADLSKVQGMGKWVSKVPGTQEHFNVTLEKLRTQLENAGADVSMLSDDFLLSFFQSGNQAPFGKNIIKATVNGRPEFYQLKTELYDTFHALDMEDSGTLMRYFSAPANLLRAGVTIAPDFALANAIRDAFSSSIISKHGLFPFEATIRGVAAMLKRPELVAEWAAAGGKNSVEAIYFNRNSMQKFMRDRITKDLSPAERALVWTKSPIAALKWLTGTAEEATRIGEYQKAFNDYVRKGMPEGEARRLAAFESRDRQDFSKGGAKTKILRHTAAFWNAGLQANVKLAQSFKERPVQTTLKGLAFITIPKLLEQALNWNDEDYWDRPQWERDLFFLIPIGKDKSGHTRFLRIPTPFEPGIIFGTLPGRMLQQAKQGGGMKDLPMTLLMNTVPNPIPQTVQVLYADFLSGPQGWDVFRSRPVVPSGLANNPPEEQWTEQTSLTAKKAGRILGFSPVKIDHIIAGTTGGAGKQVINQGIDRAISAVTGEKRTSQLGIPGSRFLSAPAGSSSQAVDEFYKTLNELRTEVKRAKLGGTPKMDISPIAAYEKASRIISDLNRAYRQTSDPDEKAMYRDEILKLAREMSVLKSGE